MCTHLQYVYISIQYYKKQLTFFKSFDISLNFNLKMVHFDKTNCKQADFILKKPYPQS